MIISTRSKGVVAELRLQRLALSGDGEREFKPPTPGNELAASPEARATFE